MWTTTRTKTALISPRPVRIVYLVPNPPSHELLNMVFDESMSRWGGRRTPIIPSDGAELADDYWNLLDLWDADIIYSYVELMDKLHARLAHRLAPSALIKHPNDNHDLRPNFNTNARLLRSISVLPMLARSQTFHAQQSLEVLDTERYADVPRDLMDSFNFASNCHSDHSLLPFARRLSLRPPSKERYAPRFRSPDEITYLDNLADLEKTISEHHSLLYLAQLSDMFAPSLSALNEYRTSWDEHLSIVIGNEVADRLLFWNGIHRYHSLMGPGNFQLLRFSPDRFANGLPDWISRLCSGQRNSRHYHNNHAPQTVVRSCSVNEDVLKGIAHQIKISGMNMSSFVQHRTDNLFEPLREHRKANMRGQKQGIFISNWKKTDI